MLFKIGTFCLKLPLRILGISQMLWWKFYLMILIVLRTFGTYDVTCQPQLMRYDTERQADKENL